MNDCIFCKIVKGEVPCAKIYEDENAVAVMDAFPVVEGQALVITKQHVPYLFDSDRNVYSSTLLAAKKIVKAIDKTFHPIRTALVVEGFDVDHSHVKLFPCYQRYLKLVPRLEPSPSFKLLEEQAQKIKKHLL